MVEWIDEEELLDKSIGDIREMLAHGPVWAVKSRPHVIAGDFRGFDRRILRQCIDLIH